MASTVGNNSSNTQTATAAPGGKIGISEDDKKRANLRVLQRVDKSITDICGANATHVVLYEFNQEKQQWEKRHVEGSLFLTRRSTEPPFKLIILNRSSRENFEVTVTAQFQMQIREPYLIFRETKSAAATAKIRGIWFHDGQERTTMAELLQGAIAEQVARKDPPAQPAPPPPTPPQAAPQPQPVPSHPPPQSSPAKAAVAPSPVRQPPPPTPEAECAGVVSATAAAVAQMATPHQESKEAAPLLDKKTLQLTLMSLLQEDKFLDVIHAQYIKVARARQSQRQQPGQQS